MDESLDHFNTDLQKSLRSLEEGAQLVEKCINAIKLADKSDYVWSTVNEYLRDELASDADDEKKMYRAENRVDKVTLSSTMAFTHHHHKPVGGKTRGQQLRDIVWVHATR